MALWPSARLVFAMRPRLSLDLSSERGTTLIELLVAIPAALAVAGAAMLVAGVFSDNERRVENRAGAIGSAQVVLDRMARDIRQASSVQVQNLSNGSVTNGPQLQLTTFVGSVTGGVTSHASGSVTWSCPAASGSLSTCTRKVGTGTAVPQLTISTGDGGSTSIFSQASGSSYVSISADVPTTYNGTSTTPNASPTITVTGGAAALNT